ncbi:ead/Ea22-like family protein [Salmonella enterica subsp. enterica serovar Newport]|nr:ead/Ea22-like family protein [Salmonella enterica]EBS1065348.1 ead/Ea22-like family protein [Salmonella enterica subsp. enterica serovar Wangata]EBZ6870516.1 ead/Ea22-like family protein [Salmonella enterica subsp. enterica serovar Newport]ECI2730855.1 ead/Ea22-like family protein [Salmonella enterica subsp. enterica]ECV8460264.1 ead/Ea22-like family protein [Salmonella enterica subsp. enterica serovar Typhimurium]EDW0273326.1 ead/Ea22-like family protein [Salmonella enterica subsp. enteric
MTALNKQALRERYSPKPVPECHICGKEMTVQRISSSRITYGCTGATYDDKGCHYADGRSIADDHYEQSRVTVVDVSDPDVLTLLDELERNQQYIKSRDQENEEIALTVGKLRVELEAAEKRIAELEARTVNLPKRSVGEVMHMSGFSRDYAEGWCAGNDNAIHEIRIAGIKVKGE